VSGLQIYIPLPFFQNFTTVFFQHKHRNTPHANACAINTTTVNILLYLDVNI